MYLVKKRCNTDCEGLSLPLPPSLRLSAEGATGNFHSLSSEFLKNVYTPITVNSTRTGSYYTQCSALFPSLFCRRYFLEVLLGRHAHPLRSPQDHRVFFCMNDHDPLIGSLLRDTQRVSSFPPLNACPVTLLGSVCLTLSPKFLLTDCYVCH